MDKFSDENQTLRQEVQPFLVEDVSDDFLSASPIEVNGIDSETILEGEIDQIKIKKTDYARWFGCIGS